MNNKGVTLVELIIVIVIIAIITAFAIPAVDSYLRHAKLRTVVNDVSVIDEAADLFTLDTGVRPKGVVSGAGTCELWNNDSRDLFQVGVKGGNDIDGWQGPYIQNWPTETPFGGCYVYRNYESNNSWSRSNWLRISDDSTIGTHVPSDEEIEIIMIRFYPLNDQKQIDLSREIGEFLREAYGDNVYYVKNQAVIGIYIDTSE